MMALELCRWHITYVCDDWLEPSYTGLCLRVVSIDLGVEISEVTHSEICKRCIIEPSFYALNQTHV